VEFRDGATVAQLGVPDMRIPIAIALSGGERLPGICAPAGLAGQTLSFEDVDPVRFPAVELARLAGMRGGVAPCALNAANEVAVEAFLGERIRFGDIIDAVAATVDAAPAIAGPALEDLIAADAWARERTREHAQAVGAHSS
jgi:1-deoxy-D-xylulose-5-phosphate reductoisomerase